MEKSNKTRTIITTLRKTFMIMTVIIIIEKQLLPIMFEATSVI